MSVGNVILALAAVYFGICYLIICSEYVQSFLVYAHFDKKPAELTNLIKMGLPQGRNIEIITEDGVMLKGWHIMNPGSDLIKANNITDESERNLHFDRSLAFAERIVLYFHGNSQTRAQPFRVELVKQLSVHLNAHVFVVDYRGFADSEGHPSEAGTSFFCMFIRMLCG